jgi:hypothetical protein
MVCKWPMNQPVQEFSMPAGSVVIDVQTQNNVPTLWTLGPAPGGPTELRIFAGYGTGHPIRHSLDTEYVGSAHGVDGWMVFHIFERVG